MGFLRTPDERFADLPDYPWQPRYMTGLAGPLRMHYLDEGPPDAEHTFLCLHGQPSWSYLYRKMIPVFLEAGGRVVAPDFFGFGRSDKPTALSDYSFHFHRNSLIALIQRLDLRNITLVCQDWGGVLGLTVPMEMPERFARLLVMNTALGTGRDPGEAFKRWLAFVERTPDLDVGWLLSRETPGMTPQTAAAYTAPFPDVRYKAGVRTFPGLVPITPDAPGADVGRRALQWWRSAWSGPTFMAVGMQDQILGMPAMLSLQRVIRGCPAPMEVHEGGHFVQEHGEPIARAALAAWG